LPGEPIVAVDADLNGEGKAGLLADVDEPELGIEEVVVKDAEGPASERQTRSSLSVQELDGAAIFEDAEDSDEAVVVGFGVEEIAYDLLLGVLALQEQVGDVGLLRHGLSVFDDSLGMLLDEGKEIHAFDLEGMIDEAVEVFVSAEGEITLEKDSIMAGEDSYNRRRESFDKTVHGVLLQTKVWLLPSDSRTPFS
jgi:hypothetical protein